jgi:L-iditol 2-dehydrogenase
MRALVWLGPRQMELVEVPRPAPGYGEVLLRVQAVGICGSELSGFLGHNSLRHPPLVMGHEFSGQVVECGKGVNLIPGARVGVNPLVTCGHCAMCRRGLDNLCLSRSLVGAHRPGAFAEFVAVPARNCHALPDGIDYVGASLLEPLACSLRTVELAALEPMERVVVLGAGAIGLLALCCARRAGAAAVAVVDTNPHRLALASAWGADRVIDAREEDPLVALAEFSGGDGVDVAIDAVGMTVTRRQAVRALRRGGRAVMIGLHEAESALEINEIVRNETTVLGSFGYTSLTFERALAMVVRGDVLPEPNWLEVRDLSTGPASFAELIDTPVSVAKIVLRP